MDHCVKAGTGRGMQQTFWVGFALILLAAGLNLGVVAAAEFAPGLLPMEAYAAYEEFKFVVTLTLAGTGLVLILRAALSHLAWGARDDGPGEITPLALRLRSGCVPMVTTRYVPTVRSRRSAAAVPPEAGPSEQADNS